jgi:hypothetical protein
MENTARIRPDGLLNLATAVYVKSGMPEADGRLSADTLVLADLWSHQFHGVMRLSWYVAEVETLVAVSERLEGQLTATLHMEPADLASADPGAEGRTYSRARMADRCEGWVRDGAWRTISADLPQPNDVGGVA